VLPGGGGASQMPILFSENPSRVAAVALGRFVFSSHRRSRGQDGMRHAAAPRSSSNTGTTQQKKKEE